MIPKFRYLAIAFGSIICTNIRYCAFACKSKNLLEIIPDFPISSDNFEQFNPHLNDLNNLMSVTHILNSTMSQQSIIVLQKWREKKMKEMGEIKFEEYIKDVMSTGSQVHRIFDQYLDDKEIPFMNSSIEGFFKSGQEILSCSQTICGNDKNVSHPFLLYKGILDNIILLKNNKEIVEFKTKNETRRVSAFKDTYDDPIQLAAYIGAYNLGKRRCDQITRGRLIYIYKDGFPATDFLIHGKHLDQSWEMWKKRLIKYFENK